MTRWLMAAAGMLVALAAWGDGARVCRTRRPDPDAFAARCVSAPGGSAVPRRAAVRLETQTDVVDILVAFDASARAWLAKNGKGSSLGYARSCVAKMNDCLARSAMLDHFRFRLAGAVELETDLSSVGRGLDDVLDRVVDGWGDVVAEGALRKVVDRREAVGADIVTILTDRGPYGIVGVGFSLEMQPDGYDFIGSAAEIARFGDWAYNVCSIQAVDEDYTMLHEIGHNMGAGHPDESQARAYDFELGPQLYGYSAGYYFWLGDQGYYTVMAYNFGGPGPDGSRGGDWRFEPAPCFSSPDVVWNGCTTGTARNDNRRTLLETCRYVAQYRPSALPVGAEGVTDAQNARAEKAWDTGRGAEVDSPDRPVAVAGFAVTGAFRPAKAVNGAAPYVGAVYSNGVVVGVVRLKVGKANLGRGECKVGGAVVLLDGKKYAIANTVVPTGDAPQRAGGISVKALGRMELVLGANGFAGVVEGTPFGQLEVRTRALDGRLSVSPACFELEASSAALSAACGLPVLEDCLPTGEPVVSASGGKWVLRRAGSVAYRSVRDAATGEKAWRLVGMDNPAKPNLSGLKLAVNTKTSTFKGGFTLYLDAGGAQKPKLRKLKAAVTGVVAGGRGHGMAVLKGVGAWPVWIR